MEKTPETREGKGPDGKLNDVMVEADFLAESDLTWHATPASEADAEETDRLIQSYLAQDMLERASAAKAVGDTSASGPMQDAGATEMVHDVGMADAPKECVMEEVVIPVPEASTRDKGVATLPMNAPVAVTAKNKRSKSGMATFGAVIIAIIVVAVFVTRFGADTPVHAAMAAEAPQTSDMYAKPAPRVAMVAKEKLPPLAIPDRRASTQKRVQVVVPEVDLTPRTAPEEMNEMRAKEVRAKFAELGIEIGGNKPHTNVLAPGFRAKLEQKFKQNPGLEKYFKERAVRDLEARFNFQVQGFAQGKPWEKFLKDTSVTLAQVRRLQVMMFQK